MRAALLKRSASNNLKEVCASGICAAAQACPSKLLRQEVPYSVPLPEPSACRACGECVRACPQKAVQIVSL
jgi:heterodisulfide reductase subunit A-like polyferredoxin